MVTLICQKRTGPKHHYQDESYHKRTEPIDPGAACWNKFSPATFHVDVGKWGVVAQPRGSIPGAKIDWANRCSHAAGVGGVSQRGVANAGDPGVVAGTGAGPWRLASAPVRRVPAGWRRRHGFLADGIAELSESTLPSGRPAGIAGSDFWDLWRGGRSEWAADGPATDV